MTATTKKQTCPICGKEYNTRGFMSHLKKCERKSVKVVEEDEEINENADTSPTLDTPPQTQFKTAVSGYPEPNEVWSSQPLVKKEFEDVTPTQDSPVKQEYQGVGRSSTSKIIKKDVVQQNNNNGEYRGLFR